MHSGLKSMFSLHSTALWTFLVLKVAIKIIVKVARLSLVSPNICNIWWFFSEFCITFGTLHFEKSSNTAKTLKKMKTNLVTITIKVPKWLLFEPKMFTFVEITLKREQWLLRLLTQPKFFSILFAVQTFVYKIPALVD